MENIIVFDDVTPGEFDGVVNAVKKIIDENYYSVEHIFSSKNRAYAVATKKQ